MTILITGAGKGIGRALALGFAERSKTHHSSSNPLSLFLTSRTEEDLHSLAAVCRDYGVKTSYLAGDLATPGFIDTLCSAAQSECGAIHCLINNAGVGRFGSFLDLTPSDYDFIMNTNLKATFFLTQRVVKTMMTSNSGHIFFITSVAAIKPFEQSALYCMSKYGQKGFIDVLRIVAARHNIRITNVMPGAVYTPMWGSEGDVYRDRMMMPEDIAQSVIDAYYLPSRTVPEEIILRPIHGDVP